MESERKTAMGEISRRLHRKLASKSHNLPTEVPKRRPGEPLPGNVPDLEMLIKDGLDSTHAVYAFIQQITSHFAEGMSQLPELKAFAKLAGDAEDKYMPTGPPMSPLTVSYFTCWAFYDLRFGRDGDTIGSCQIDANDIFLMNPDQLDALKKLSESRMGIYEHIRSESRFVHLRELITGEEFRCLSTSGYQGRPGEVWYVRRLRPLMPDLANYHVLFTTPYILIEATKDDWNQFLRRTLLKVRGKDDRERLHRLLKYGFDTNYWNEFVFKSYHHHQSDAIFLAGIPDLKGTLPHA
jgi:hypothetical protein